MASTEKECACGCGKRFYGTKRAMYFNAACKMRHRRLKEKNKGVSSVSKTIVTTLNIKIKQGQ